MNTIEYAVFTKDDGYHVGWIGKHHRCSKFGPFETEDDAKRICKTLNEERKTTKSIKLTHCSQCKTRVRIGKRIKHKFICIKCYELSVNP